MKINNIRLEGGRGGLGYFYLGYFGLGLYVMFELVVILVIW